jgi:phytoene dehydrogenase-like protein
MQRRANIIGGGVNGLTAAAKLAKAGWHVTVYEATSAVGGAAKTVMLATPAFFHDVGASIVPMAPLSPAFADLGVTEAVEFIIPAVSVSHPFDNQPAVGLSPGIGLVGSGDLSWDRWMRRAADSADRTARVMLSFPIPQLRDAPHALLLGSQSLRRATAVARGFDSPEAGALFAGLAAHAVAPLGHRGVAGIGLSLGAIAQTTGWPVVAGGTQVVVDYLTDLIQTHGGRILVDTLVSSLDEVGTADAVLLATSAPAAARIAGDLVQPRLSHRLARTAPGPGVYKLDWALKGPIPWNDPLCTQSATVHLGATVEEVEASELAMWNGRVSDEPFVILAQPTTADPTRAPAGRHTAWAYAHVPHGWQGELTDAIERQVERFASGFSKRVLHRTVSSPADLENANANLRGGDLGMGAFGILPMIRRPRFGRYPHRIGSGLYLASAAASPGPGLHGMAGYRAALTAIHDRPT